MSNNKYFNAGLFLMSIMSVIMIRSEVSRMSYSVYAKSNKAKYSEAGREKLAVHYAGQIGADALAAGSNKMISLKAPKKSQVVHVNTKDIAVIR